MNVEHNLDPNAASSAAKPRATRTQFINQDDKDMLRAVRDITSDLGEARGAIYWPDMLLSAGIGYGALAGAILVQNLYLAVALGLVSALSLYRALMFIHELTHIHRDALPGFRLAWNALVGVPLLTSCTKGCTHCITSARNMALLMILNICRWR